MAGMDVPHSNAIQPELVVDGAVAVGGSTDLALLMHTKPGWHGYWLNPGDAGLPMDVQWTLPAGWSVETLRYPVPTRLLVSGITNYVYEKDYAVLTRLHAPADARGTQRISAALRWLACTEKVCVPEEGEVSLSVNVGTGADRDPRFDHWRQALPRPLTSPAHFSANGATLNVAVPLPATLGIEQPYLFPMTEGVVDYAKPQRFRRSGDWVVGELPTSGPVGKAFDGLLVTGGGQGFTFHAVPGAVPSGGSAIGSSGAGANATLFAALVGALLGGLLLNLMPCVFPILAMKALHLARAGGNETEARREALSYAAGTVAGTAGLGAILLAIRAGGSAAGWAFQLQDPRAILILLLLATAITLNLLKVFELPVLAGEASPAGSFGTGALAAFVATPCSGPFLGAALGAALLLPLWGSVLVFGVLGLGLALPFVLLAFAPPLRRMLPRPGAWMARLQRFLAVPMAATIAGALWLLYRQSGTAGMLVGVLVAVMFGLLLAGAGWRQTQGARVWPLVIAGSAFFAVLGISLLPPAGSGGAHTPAGTIRWSEAAVAKAHSAGKPAFVYFTADWCLTCKANEAGAIDRDETQKAFRKAGVQTFEGDWTNGDPAIGRFLEARGRAGVPLYLWYAPGAAEPEELPQILTPSMLVERATASSAR
jgi:DsbC/DsbD-like thiol-disulfide interchange protein/cytochrome c biogenesis protein CcdA